MHVVGSCLGDMNKLTEAKEYLEKALQIKTRNIDDKASLLHHYHTFHQLTLQTKPDIVDCFLECL